MPSVLSRPDAERRPVGPAPARGDGRDDPATLRLARPARGATPTGRRAARAAPRAVPSSAPGAAGDTPRAVWWLTTALLGVGLVWYAASVLAVLAVLVAATAVALAAAGVEALLRRLRGVPAAPRAPGLLAMARQTLRPANAHPAPRSAAHPATRHPAARAAAARPTPSAAMRQPAARGDLALHSETPS